MHVENIRDYCLAKAAVTESFPFDETTLIFKVADKVFALLNLDKKHLSINLKCNPERSLELRERYLSIKPGYHMNKTHWNTLIVEGELPKQLVEDLIDHSYNLVVSKLTKKVKLHYNLD
jgi:predicted DNA-binding protein (MmcQ/YjbR family)